VSGSERNGDVRVAVYAFYLGDGSWVERYRLAHPEDLEMGLGDGDFEHGILARGG